MTHYFCQPGSLIGGDIRVPGDKSISVRATILASIAEGPTHVRGFLESGDTLSTIVALRELGVNIARQGGNKLLVHGVGADGLKPSPRPLDLGNSGAAMRILAGLLAGQPFDSTLIGDASLDRRPRLVKDIVLVRGAPSQGNGSAE